MEQLKASLGFLPSWAIEPLVALIVIVVGYVIAKVLAAIVAGGINRTGIGRQAKTTGGNIGKSLSKAVFWVVWLVFIVIALSNFEQLSGEGGALQPLKELLNSIFGYLPNLIGTALILAIGLILAKVGKEATSSTLEAAQVDRLASRFNVVEDGAPSNGIARAIGGLVWGIIMLFIGSAAVDTLAIDSISTPVKGMLEMVLDYIPRVIGAVILLAIFVFIGRFVSRLAESTLPTLGFDRSLSAISGLDGSDDSRVKPSRVVGLIAFVGIALLGLTAAVGTLGIEQLTEVFETLLGFGGSIVMGAIIIGAGLFIANFVSNLVSQTAGDLAGRIVKYVTIVLVTFMGLSQMGIGQDIVNTAFQYALGAAAVSAGVGGAIAFGFGGRDWAGSKLSQWSPAKGTKQATKK